ncbi:MAG: hypothetical protein U9N77_12530 [Thermodesulfobacteriota bacterium]|nr:hypothetical protein [Thermodesulfobacteriota bacterium]
MSLRTTVSSKGKFLVGEHRPYFKVKNFRKNDSMASLGTLPDGTDINNEINFPENNITEPGADIIYEIPNPFPFRGTTYINSRWADKNAEHPENISLPQKPCLSFSNTIKKWLKKKGIKEENGDDLLEIMPEPLLIALASTSTDPEELVRLAKISCSFSFEEKKKEPSDQKEKGPSGLLFKKGKNGNNLPDIKNHTLFEILVNNRHLPDEYKVAMVLKPGIQGASEITGEWQTDEKNREHSHIFEYLRRNSYIPWGHFAANTADDTVRYRIKDLSFNDMRGMRHLFYQRIYAGLAEQLKIEIPVFRKQLSKEQLEVLRREIRKELKSENRKKLEFNASLWGWNFGFGYAQSGYRLHASHQQIHQQYAMIPGEVSLSSSRVMPSYGCGDMIAEFIEEYRKDTGKSFFENYLKAIRSNQRVDKNSMGPSDLVIFEDENILLFVPKAQTSQWELQLMPIKKCGNILEADDKMRKSLDRAILMALQTLEAMGAEMVTSIEFSKRFDSTNSDHQLLYSFLPKIPYSPGAFSEAQLRWINGHYPEDFAIACRSVQG